MSINEGDQAAVRANYQDAEKLRARMRLHENYTVAEESFFAWTYRQMNLAPGARVLEVGCGDGRLWQEAADKLPEGVSLTLTDYSEGMLSAARARLAPDFPNGIVYRQADACHLPFADGSFDLLVADHMRFHVPDIEAALREFRRVLKENGRLIAATNGDNNLRELREMAGYERVAISFTKENGAAMLTRAFAHVEWRDYPSRLFVTDAEAIVDYARSMRDFVKTPDETWEERVRAAAQTEIAAHGGVSIRKSSGLFLAWD